MTKNDENYKDASFRNVPFFVESANQNGSRKISITEIAGSDNPIIQDQGKGANYYNLEAYVVGFDYYPDRNALIEALELEGPGKLIHPYLGERTVRIISWIQNERVGEGGRCFFSINMVDVSTAGLELIEKDPILESFNSREAALSTLSDVFLDGYEIANKPTSVVNNAKETLSVGIEAIKKARVLYETVPELQYQISKLRSEVDSAVLDATRLQKDMYEIMTFGTFLSGEYAATTTNALILYEELLSLFEFQAVETLQNPLDPANIIAANIRETALLVCSSMTSLIQFESFEEARETRDILFKKIDIVLKNPLTPASYYNSLRDMRAKVGDDIETRGVNLSRTIVVDYPDEMPAILIAYQLYGDYTREQEIIDRNQLLNPVMIPARTAIEVLQNA